MSKPPIKKTPSTTLEPAPKPRKHHSTDEPTAKEHPMIQMKPKPTPAMPSVLASILIDRLGFMVADIDEALTAAGVSPKTNKALTELKALAADTSDIAQALEAMLLRTQQ